MTFSPLKILFNLLTVAGLGLLAVSPAIAADNKVNAGVLKCDVAGGKSFVFGATRHVDCHFSPAGKEAVDSYKGEIHTYGVDIGYIKAGVIIWTVLAPSTNVKTGALAGTYVGATASAAAGAGMGVNVLAGGGNSFALQPLSISGQKGVNIAAGLTKLTLQQ
jgi:Protein of unknown function (DUF992)